MNEYRYTMDKLQELLELVYRDNLSTPEKAAIFAAACALEKQICKRLEKGDVNGRANVKTKLRGARESIAVATGFGHDRGHSFEQHHLWGVGSLHNAEAGMTQVGLFDD